MALLDPRPLTISTVPAASLTMGRFLHAALEPLGLELLAGKNGLRRVILEPVLHRPGLALTGFYEYFAWRQMQLFGRSEMTYLRTLDGDCRRARWQALLQHDVPCIILCTAEKESLDGELLAMADQMAVPVLATRQKSFAVFRVGSLLLHELTTPRATVHGSLVDVRGVGVLLEGPPGIGKSETALGLVRHGCALIADDITRLWVDAHGSLWGTAPDHMRGFMEIRGLGLLHIPTLFGISAVRPESRLELIVSLRRCGPDDDIDRVGSDVKTCEVLGHPVQRLLIPVAAGRDFVNVVETAAATYKMRSSGIDAAAILDEQLISHYQSVEQQHE